MRALKVYENISFERGQDPRKSLGVGSFRGGKVLFDSIFAEGRSIPGILVYPQAPSEIEPRLQSLYYSKLLPSPPVFYFKIVLNSRVYGRPYGTEDWTIHVILTEDESVWGYIPESKKTLQKLESLSDFFKFAKRIPKIKK